jgi:hypothetical protein
MGKMSPQCLPSSLPELTTLGCAAEWLRSVNRHL